MTRNRTVELVVTWLRVFRNRDHHPLAIGQVFRDPECVDGKVVLGEADVGDLDRVARRERELVLAPLVGIIGFQLSDSVTGGLTAVIRFNVITSGLICVVDLIVAFTGVFTGIGVFFHRFRRRRGRIDRWRLFEVVTVFALAVVAFGLCHGRAGFGDRGVVDVVPVTTRDQGDELTHLLFVKVLSE